jgi:riboflavin kinase/FMN adenylyltransferase
MPFLQKEKIMAELGVQRLFVVEFNQALAALTSETFVSDYLIGLCAAHVVVGFDFNYGSKGKGNADTLEVDGEGNYGVTVVPKVEYNGQKISSTLIRKLLKVGDVQQISFLLGDFYETRGRANIESGVLKHQRIQIEYHPLPQYMLPPPGRYVIRVEWNNKTMHGIARVELCMWSNTSVYLEILAPTNEQWNIEILNIKWVKQLSSSEEHHSHEYFYFEMPIQIRR